MLSIAFRQSILHNDLLIFDGTFPLGGYSWTEFAPPLSHRSETIDLPGKAIVLAVLSMAAQARLRLPTWNPPIAAPTRRPSIERRRAHIRKGGLLQQCH
jgi:hypothetical protein